MGGVGPKPAKELVPGRPENGALQPPRPSPRFEEATKKQPQGPDRIHPMRIPLEKEWIP